MNIKNIVDWNIFWSLFMAAELSMFASLPYAVSISGDAIYKFGGSFPTVLATQFAQGTGLLILSIYTGLFLGKKVGLRASVLEALFEGRGLPSDFSSSARLSISLGFLIGLVIFSFDRLVLSMFTEPLTILLSSPPLGQRLLYSFYAGIVEEMILRFFLVTLLVWITWKIKKTSYGLPTNAGMYFSIISVSIVYGLGYLSSISSTIDPDIAVSLGIVGLGIISGTTFGWLYWKKGIEAAVIANLSASLTIFVVLGSLF